MTKREPITLEEQFRYLRLFNNLKFNYSGILSIDGSPLKVVSESVPDGVTRSFKSRLSHWKRILGDVRYPTNHL